MAKSTSFIIKGSAYPSIYALAVEMVHQRNAESKDFPYGSNVASIIIKGEVDNVCFDNKFGISFRSCNYDTYIVKRNKYYLVSTCNNHNFEIVGDMRSIGLASDMINFIIRKYDDGKCELSHSPVGAAYDIVEIDMPKKEIFWFPECDLYGTPSNAWCDKHYSTKIINHEIRWKKVITEDIITGVICSECELEK